MAASSVSITKDKFLGKGGFASVYLHYDEKTNAFVAVKRIDVGPVESEDANITKELKAVRKEISLMKDLDHKRIIRYIRDGRESNIFSIYMEYVCGGSVKNKLIKNGAFSEDTTKKYALQLLEGLSYLHHKRIIHRDVKGSNILCDDKGNIKLADFGISKQMNRLYTLTIKATKNTAMKGTGYWMAPEVIKAAKYGTRADIWSTGATVVEMLTTHPPWYELEQFQAMFKIGSLEKGGYALDSKISRDAKDFLAQTFMLEEQRPRADKLLQHSWLKAVYAVPPPPKESMRQQFQQLLQQVPQLQMQLPEQELRQQQRQQHLEQDLQKLHLEHDLQQVLRGHELRQQQLQREQGQQHQQRGQPAPQRVPQPPVSRDPYYGKGKVFRSMYDYDAADEDEFGFREGDLIINCKPIDEGWMMGTLERTGQSGMLPSNFVERVNW